MNTLIQYKKWKFQRSYLFSLGLLFLILNSCDKTPIESPEDRKERILAAVELRLEDRRKKKMGDCRKDALVISEKKVDSILMADAKLNIIDTIKPGIPTKPETPEILLPKDSTPVKPLFDKVPDSLGAKIINE